MNVIQIIPKMNVGGVERGILDIVKYFKNKQIKNIVISGGGRLVADLKRNKIAHYQLPVYRKSPTALSLIPKIKKIIEKENVNILHGRSRVPAWLGFFATRATNTHFVTTAHGVYNNRIFSEVMGWGKFVICPSKIVARHMHEKFGVPEDKVVIINRWVDMDKFRFASYDHKAASNEIVSIGRIAPNKGYEYLIEAFRKLVRINSYLKLKIIGSADESRMEYFNYLKSLVTRYSLDYNVEFMGFRDDVENVLRNARMLVACSISDESFGRVIIEAFACGVPVIATKVGGFSEIIDDGKNGFLVQPKDSEAIKDGILKVLNDTKLAQDFVDQGYKKVSTLYTMEKALMETEAVYKKTLEFNRILVIKISSLGDLILAIPSLKALKERFPQGKICLLTSKQYTSLIYKCPYVDEVLTVEDKYKGIKNILSLTRRLRRYSFDYVVDLQNNYASHLIAFLAFPRYSFGYSLRGGKLLTKNIKYCHQDSPLVSQEKILNLLGIKLYEKKLIFWPTDDNAADKLADGQFIGVNMAASSKWSSKNWPLENIKQFAELINKNLPSYKIVLLGTEDAVNSATMLESSLGFPIVNLCGKVTLGQLPAVIKRLKILITPDTATLHLAVALNISTIGLFGPTNPWSHIVKSDNLCIFVKKFPCSYCYSPRCRNVDKNLCMKTIAAQEIFAKAKNILGIENNLA